MKKPAKSVRSPRPRTSVSKRPAVDADDILPEYDSALIRSGVRGKYAAAFAEGSNVVVLDPDVAREFPNAAAVNDALRGLAVIIREHHAPKRRDRSSRRTA
ncbi:hypothetical protein BH09GEM1_BH09GEM1_26330 [soil metagenome]